VKRLKDLDFSVAKSMGGVTCVIFDKDNTLTKTYSDELHEEVVDQVQEAKRIFGPEAVAILSNSVGSSDDKGYAGAALCESHLGLAVIRHEVKKPGCLTEVQQHFARATARIVAANEILVVGDRLLTDVLFANLNGMQSVLVAPLCTRTDHPVAVIIRFLERRLLLPLVQTWLALWRR